MYLKLCVFSDYRMLFICLWFKLQNPYQFIFPGLSVRSILISSVMVIDLSVFLCNLFNFAFFVLSLLLLHTSSYFLSSGGACCFSIIEDTGKLPYFSLWVILSLRVKLFKDLSFMWDLSSISKPCVSPRPWDLPAQGH